MRSRHDRILDLAARQIGLGVELGIIQRSIEDAALDDATITIDGRTMVNFSSCAYLGINRDQRLRDSAIDAIRRYGANYSSAPIYTALPMYEELGRQLSEMTGGAAAVVQTTTLAHISALPILIGPSDIALIDAQTHDSVHLATVNLKGNGVAVETYPHADADALTRRVGEVVDQYDRVWVLTDSIFSMYGDVAPIREIAALQERYSNVHAYYDDAHGFGWAGERGAGYVLSQVPWNNRMVIAAGLAKSFGSFGAVLAFGDESLVQRVKITGGALTFSGPIPPADLGAATASAAIHLSQEHPVLQAELLDFIHWGRTEILARNLPVVSLETTPIWFVRIGTAADAGAILQRLMADGYYLNVSAFPAVPLGHAGIRFTQTRNHTREQVTGLLDSIATHLADFDLGPEIVVDLRSDVPAVGATE
jgi:7-keto-8-aminopelargonate synthetase-like enzyme